MIEGSPATASYEFDKPKEECGIFGIYGEDLPVAELTHGALEVLQHRGQEGAGIVVSTGSRLSGVRGLGLLSEALHNGRDLKGLPEGFIAAGHVRYGTFNGQKDSEKIRTIQPLIESSS